MPEGKSKPLTRRQFAVMCWVALISPIIRQSPRPLVIEAGRAAWLSAAAAVPLLALLLLFLRRLLRDLSPGEGLGDVFCRALGDLGGRLALFVYALWLLVYTGYVLRAGADRFVAAVYPNSRPAVFILVMAALGTVAALGRLKALARCAEAAQPVLIAVFLLVFLCALPDADWDNLLPVSRQDILPVGRAALTVTNATGIAVYSAFLMGQAEPGGVVRPLLWPLAQLLLLITLLCIATVGRFGAELTSQMSYPFFVMIRDVHVFKLLERVEALVIAQWVIADFVLVSLLLHVCSENLSRAFSGSRESSRVLWVAVCVLAAVLAAFVCAPTAFDLLPLSLEAMPFSSAALIFVGLPLIFLIGRLRRRL